MTPTVSPPGAPPESLPGRLYLLACDPRNGRLTGKAGIGLLLRAAALADLLADGRLTDDGGRPRTSDAARRQPATDPVVAAVLAEVAASRPRSWSHWIRRGARATAVAVREQLVAGGWIEVEPRRLLGYPAGCRVTLRAPAARRQLATAVADALRETRPVSRVDRRDAALVALAAAAELRAVLGRRERRHHRERIGRLAESTGPPVRAYRKVRAAAAAAAAGG